jgi:hypothetical protein
MAKFPHYVIQVGYAVFGAGNTPEEALAEANKWVDRESPLSLDSLASPTSAHMGEMALVDGEYIDRHAYRVANLD